MKIDEPKFCKSCQEMVYSRLCPYCEQPAGEMDYTLDAKANEIQVDEGLEESYEGGVQALNFDECWGTESDSD